MHPGKKILIATTFALLCASISPKIAAQDLKTVLARLDAAATNFHSTSADFEFDSYANRSSPRHRRAKGHVVYYERQERRDSDGGPHQRGERKAGPQSLYVV